MGSKKFSEHIDKSAKELLESRKQKTTFWQFANVLGVGGWVFVIPIVGGAYLGRYLDKKFGNEGISWTITLIIIGIAAGAFNVWHFFVKKSKQ
ncbi:MAG: AtpZ/AtpI family protein [Candidatus Brocadiaceae bacterium]|nr:AtpZ/AtpI family protein [Candidatus Brocadiaceae bacterium]